MISCLFPLKCGVYESIPMNQLALKEKNPIKIISYRVPMIPPHQRMIEIAAGDMMVFLCRLLPHLYSYPSKMNETIYTGYSTCAIWYTKTW